MDEQEGNGAQQNPLPSLRTPRPLAEDAADAIREQILGGGFRSGERLVEAKIAEQLNVSRGPVREAFKLLRAEGLVEEEPRRGTFVASISGADVREIYGVRAAVEARAAKLLTRSGDEGALGELRELLAQMESEAGGGDAWKLSQADLRFHESICRLSGNSRLYEVFRRYVPMLRGLLRLDEYLFSVPAEIAAQHRPLLEAIESGDAGLAAARFEDHSEQACDRVVEYLATRPDAPGRDPGPG